MSVGMDVAEHYESEKQDLAEKLEAAAYIADRINLSITLHAEGKEVSTLFREISQQLKESARAYCIADGCGMEFDPYDVWLERDKPVPKAGEMLRPYWKHYCPKHRLIKG